ncbi:hypothetical protein YDYSY3_41010 [Paenibacillus chitinolyticus]|nr:hypothetical protein YDYSY3_41010 [Paenibacillus chitinolyticus]
MSIRYPINFIFFIVVFLIVDLLPLNSIVKIVLCVILLGVLDFMIIKTGIDNKKVPVYAGVGSMAVVVAVLLSFE